jgi:hypothetical protein
VTPVSLIATQRKRALSLTVRRPLDSGAALSLTVLSLGVSERPAREKRSEEEVEKKRGKEEERERERQRERQRDRESDRGTTVRRVVCRAIV